MILCFVTDSSRKSIERSTRFVDGVYYPFTVYLVANNAINSRHVNMNRRHANCVSSKKRQREREREIEIERETLALPRHKIRNPRKRQARSLIKNS